MDVDTKKKISDATQKFYSVVDITDPKKARIWKHQSLAYHCKRVYGISLADWKGAYNRKYKNWVIKDFNPRDYAAIIGSSRMNGKASSLKEMFIYVDNPNFKETPDTPPKPSMVDFVKNKRWKELRDMRRRRL